MEQKASIENWVFWNDSIIFIDEKTEKYDGTRETSFKNNNKWKVIEWFMLDGREQK